MVASKAMQDRVLRNPNVEILYNTLVEDVYGDVQDTHAKYVYKPQVEHAQQYNRCFDGH